MIENDKVNIKGGLSMDPKKILLADSGYTVRRIIELTITQEFGVELIVLESGEEIKQKLLENKPAIVLVDVNLPIIDGYDVCKFINNEESLKDTEVLLMISNVEEIDKTKAIGLKYNDVIKKPVDINFLTQKINSLLENSKESNNLKSNENSVSNEESLNFDDISIGEEDLLPPESDSNDNADLSSPILPSDEITQTRGEEEDLLVNKESDEDEELPNPFEDEEDTDSIKISDKEESKGDDLAWLPKEKVEIKEQFVQGTQSEAKEEGVEIEEKIEDYHKDIVTDEINVDKNVDDDVSDLEIKEELSQIEELEIDDKEESAEQVEYEIEHERSWADDISFENKSSNLKEKVYQEEKSLEAMMSGNFDDDSSAAIKGQISLDEPEESVEDKDKFFNPSEPLIEEEGATINDYIAKDVNIAETDVKQDVISESEEIEQNDDLDKPLAEEEIPHKEPSVNNQLEFTSEDKERIIASIEDKLTASLKEVLWDIIPPIAEKVIKSEIDKINENIENQLKDLQ